ncbi:MAG: T9SS type A sorting domain-containing protein [Ignavibacteria bacterium]|nr:T9SS type A sorting domain-containing protein [Ignavibacteria bacterium]
MNRLLLTGMMTLAVTVLPNSVFTQSGQERIIWRFEMDSEISGSEVSVGPDGTIYTSDATKLYAINPNGTVKWTRPGLVGTLAATTSIDFLDDGTIVTGSDSSIVALNPDGSTRWTFSFDASDLNSHLQVGPSVGPDGNIYGVTGIGSTGSGLGAFSLTPDGDLRWNDHGNPPLAPINSSTGGRVYFTSERMIFPFDIVSGGSNLVYGYDFSGQQTLFVDFTCTGIPRTAPLDRLLIASACGIESWDQDGNSMFWSVNFGAVNLAPAIGSDGTAYAAGWFGNVNAINPDGTIAWTSATAGDAIRMLAARQDIGQMVYSGATNFGVPSFVSGVSTANGDLLWTVDMTTIDGHNELVWSHHAPTSDDGSVVYFSTRFTSNGVPGALYAVRVTEGNVSCSDIDLFQAKCQGEGTLRFRVLLMNSTEFEGEEVVFDVDGEEYAATLQSNGTHSRAQLQVDGQGPGEHVVSLVSPSGCFEPVVVSCGPAAPARSDWASDDDRFWTLQAGGNESSSDAPMAVSIGGNYPNPFNPSTTIDYTLTQDAFVRLEVFNTLGQRVGLLREEHQTEGRHTVVFDADGLPSGIYFYRLQAGSVVETRTMLLLK